MGIVRTKVFEFDLGDGRMVKLKLASLAMKEGIDYVEQGREFLKPEANTSADQWRERSMKLLLTSLNKANPDDQWSEDRVNAEFDFQLFDEVHARILEFSRLIPVQRAGEVSAAAGETQQPSAKSVAA